MMAYGNITSEQIETFLSVAKTLNMRKSAEDLAVTQSAVSKRISSLESATGIILFTNHKNNLNLTPAGKYLYNELKKEYSYMKQILRHAQTVQKSAQQVFNIGTSTRVNANVMMQAINLFKDRFPELDVNVIIDNSELLVDRLVSGEVNIITQPIANVEMLPDISYRVFSKMLFRILVAQDHPVFGNDNWTVDDLLKEKMYFSGDGLSNSRIHRNNLHQLAKENKTSIIEVPTMESVFYNLMMHKGITIYAGIPTDSNMNLISIPFEDISYDVGLCYKSHHDKNVKGFIDAFEEIMAIDENKIIMDCTFGKIGD